MSDDETPGVNEQIRRSIRVRFGNGRRFTVRRLRRAAPELSHVQNLRQRVHCLAHAGFLRVIRRGSGNRFATNGELSQFTISEVSRGGVTVSKRGRAYFVDLDTFWAARMDAVTVELGMSPVLYLRELVESDLARRAE